jgi:hypothetical protein
MALALAGCGGASTGVDRADKAGLAIDIYGCPDLSGTYAFAPPGEQGVNYTGSMLEAFPIEWGNRVPPEQIRAVSIRRFAPGAFEFRFQIDDARVMQHLALIREFYKPRYREWYHLLQEPERSASIARNGAEGHAKRVRELGPPAEVVVEVRSGTHVTCRKGWLQLPREHTDHPIRLTLGEDGSILGESDELSTYDIPIWCGDGCKDLRIPTGTYTGTLRWPRDGAQRPWRAEDLAARGALERPIDEIEAEQRALVETRRRSDARRYLPAEAIRARLEAMAPSGTVVDTVEVDDGKVRIRYTAPTAEVDRLLERIEAAGGVGVTRAPQEVQRIVTSGRFHVRSVAFVLTDSPLVLRDAAASPVVAAVDPAAAEAAATGMLTLSVAEPRRASDRQVMPRPSAGGAAALPASDRASRTPPAGTADPFAIQRRLAPLFPDGCRIVDVRYDGALVRLSGQSEQHRCVSEGLRALDRAGAQPELQSIEGDPRGGYAFRISIQASPLTQR